MRGQLKNIDSFIKINLKTMKVFFNEKSFPMKYNVVPLKTPIK